MKYPIYVQKAEKENFTSEAYFYTSAYTETNGYLNPTMLVWHRNILLSQVKKREKGKNSVFFQCLHLEKLSHCNRKRAGSQKLLKLSIKVKRTATKLQQYLNSNLKLLSTQIKHILQFWLKNTNRRGGRDENNTRRNTLTTYIIRLNQNTEEMTGSFSSSLKWLTTINSLQRWFLSILINFWGKITQKKKKKQNCNSKMATWNIRGLF